MNGQLSFPFPEKPGYLLKDKFLEREDGGSDNTQIY